MSDETPQRFRVQDSPYIVQYLDEDCPQSRLGDGVWSFSATQRPSLDRFDFPFPHSFKVWGIRWIECKPHLLFGKLSLKSGIHGTEYLLQFGITSVEVGATVRHQLVGLASSGYKMPQGHEEGIAVRTVK